MVRLREFLADPIRVMRLFVTVIALGCLLAGLLQDNLVGGFAFAVIGSLALIELRILNQ